MTGPKGVGLQYCKLLGHVCSFFIATCSVIGHVGHPRGRGRVGEIEPDVGHWERVPGHLIVPYTLFLLSVFVNMLCYVFVAMLLYPVRKGIIQFALYPRLGWLH